MTPEQARILMKQRGWTTATLAVRWGISENWLNKIISRDDLRPAHYSDAFAGLPFYQPTLPLSAGIALHESYYPPRR